MSQPNGQAHKAVVLCMTPYVSQLPTGFTLVIPTQHWNSGSQSLYLPLKAASHFIFFIAYGDFASPGPTLVYVVKPVLREILTLTIVPVGPRTPTMPSSPC